MFCGKFVRCLSAKVFSAIVRRAANVSYNNNTGGTSKQSTRVFSAKSHFLIRENFLPAIRILSKISGYVRARIRIRIFIRISRDQKRAPHEKIKGHRRLVQDTDAGAVERPGLIQRDSQFRSSNRPSILHMKILESTSSGAPSSGSVFPA